MENLKIQNQGNLACERNNSDLWTNDIKIFTFTLWYSLHEMSSERNSVLVIVVGYYLNYNKVEVNDHAVIIRMTCDEWRPPTAMYGYLDNIYHYKLVGTQIPHNVRWVVISYSSTKYFFHRASDQRLFSWRVQSIVTQRGRNNDYCY